MSADIKPLVDAIAELIKAMPIEGQIQALNEARERLHAVSPFANEPIDFVRWVPSEIVTANDYNPNSVAPPEMELLRVSIMADGYTQPVVTHAEADQLTVVDGFHRTRVGKELADVKTRVHGFLPVVQIRKEQSDKSDRIASTIRHNRARGKHRVEAMSDIVVELKRRNWSDEKIARELGMDSDEVLRLAQITGLSEAFKDVQFTEGWETEKGPTFGDEALSDVISDYAPDDGDRILHTWDKWECYRAGFYAERPPNGMTQAQGEEEYRAFLSDLGAFEKALHTVITEWKFSCEHYLTNDRMNRIAWLGQASVAQARFIPSGCRGGYNLMADEQKRAADALALVYLNKWLEANGREAVTLEMAGGRTDAELY